MIQFQQPVKFLGQETKKGTNNKGRDWEITEAVIFVPDVGRVRVIVNGSPAMPEPHSMINLALSVEQGSFQSIRLVWDVSSKFAVVK